MENMTEDEQFRILIDYVKSRDVENVATASSLSEQRTDLSEESRDLELVCLHLDQVEHDGYYVCSACGLVLDTLYQPEVNWTDRCVISKSYSSTDRIQAVDRHLIEFMQKTGIVSPLHPIQERLKFMKKESGYKSLNYAIALTCILEGDCDSIMKLLPFLPDSNVAWARSSRMLRPQPPSFVMAWLYHLMKNPRPLSKSQLKKFHDHVSLFQPDHVDLMYRLIRCYGCYGYDLDALPHDLKCALYRYSCAILKVS